MSSSSIPIPSQPSAYVSKNTNHLLTWKNPVETGKVFGSIILTLISLKYFNIINLVLRLAFYALILSATAEYAGKLILGTGFITRVRPVYVDFFHKNANSIGAHLTESLKVAELKIQDLIYSKDIEKTFKTAIVTYFFYKLTSWFSIFTLLLTSTILAFTAPAVYETNKEQIDELIKDSTKILKQKSLEFQEIAKEKSAPYLQKLGPVGSFIQSKLPKNRTATSTVGGSSAAQVHPEVSEPIKAATTGIDLPNVPNTPIGSTAAGEVDINKLESELKHNKASVESAF